MSIASEITRLQGVKSDILTAIADKGVAVPADSMLDDCPDLIASISTGGGGSVIFPDGIEEVESVKANNADVHFSFDNPINDDDLIYELIGKIEDLPQSPYSVLINKNNSVATCTRRDGRVDSYLSATSVYLPTNDFFTLTEKNNTINGAASSGKVGSLNYLTLFKKMGAQTLANYAGRIKKFTLYFENPTMKIIELVPVHNKNNGKYGLYDIISNTLFETGFLQ